MAKKKKYDENADRLDHFRYLKDAARLTRDAYLKWARHPNHELIALYEKEQAPEELRQKLMAFKARGPKLYRDMITAKRMLDEYLKKTPARQKLVMSMKLHGWR